MKVFFVLFSFLFLAVFSLNLLAKTVVVTIAPLASAIKPLLSEGDKVVVLLGKNQSVHHFSLKPSHLFAITKADLIISVGLGIDNWAEKAIKRSGAKSIVLSKIKDINLLAVSQHDHGHDHHHGHSHHADYDAHLWLDIDNMQLLAERVAVELSVENKLSDWSAELVLANQKINQRLQKIANKPFLVQHPGFQYFEKKYNLTNAGSIETNDAGSGVKKLLHLRDEIVAKNIACIFASPHGSNKQISVLVDDLKHQIKVVSLNPMGDANLNTAQVMLNLADDYLECLSD